VCEVVLPILSWKMSAYLLCGEWGWSECPLCGDLTADTTCLSKVFQGSGSREGGGRGLRVSL
jgi:hypothetical protein